MKKHSEAHQRRRSSLLVLPLLTLPFLAMGFWALGGGKGTEAAALPATKGLNLQLPGPQLENNLGQGKLGLYEQARRRLHKQGRMDKDGLLHLVGITNGEDEKLNGGSQNDRAANPTLALPAAGLASTVPGSLIKKDPNEEKINLRLAQLSQLVNQESPAIKAMPTQQITAGSSAAKQDTRFRQDVEKLEQMMQNMARPDRGPDPEMQQLEGMLERILDIQHPERVKERRREHSSQIVQQSFIVQPVSGAPPVTLLQAGTSSSLTTAPSPIVPGLPKPETPQAHAQNGFFGLSDMQGEAAQNANTVEAAVDETQTLTSGNTLRLRLLQDVFLAGKLLPGGSLLYGICQIRGKRLTIMINSVRLGNSVHPVSLVAYDLDGMEGLFIPGSPIRETARQEASEAVGQNLQLSSLSPSLGVQVAGAGIEAAKGLLSRQARQVKVTVKAGHLLLLRAQNPRQ
ncbi:conjugative transposon TraM protein [Pontibacter ummariensis]|uniref:Bacteroides conjugative transposon TraM protein n=1 Tax=Pontibacter ummariensis TaxID=1610492 RepID=A0A239LM06_9BACT|nr:conjugative transposon protein TraM [Pontibacter ummariensis]PRY02757.1 conjugative transposon TraM protein [Pontibacter ummariensis]SNT30932.1 Bacteroides conjugative transposon TraM protein [Pontibacter ummariensis]